MTSKKKPPRWTPQVGQALGPQEQAVADALQGKTFSAVAFLYARVTDITFAEATKKDPRMMQQKIGAIVARFNKKRKGQRIVPGPHPLTYKVARVRAAR